MSVQYPRMRPEGWQSYVCAKRTRSQVADRKPAEIGVLYSRAFPTVTTGNARRDSVSKLQFSTIR